MVFFVVVLYAHISTLLFAVLSSPLYYPSVLYRTVTASAQIDLRQLQILNYAISMLLPPLSYCYLSHFLIQIWVLMCSISTC